MATSQKTPTTTPSKAVASNLFDMFIIAKYSYTSCYNKAMELYSRFAHDGATQVDKAILAPKGTNNMLALALITLAAIAILTIGLRLLSRPNKSRSTK